MMETPLWLRLCSPAPGFQGMGVLHNTDVSLGTHSSVLFCVGNHLKEAFLEGLCKARRSASNTLSLYTWGLSTVIDYQIGQSQDLHRMNGGPLPTTAQQHHLACLHPPQLVSRIMRLTSTVLLFADDLGGTTGSARLLAQCIEDSMDDRNLGCPVLIVVQHAALAGCRDFCRALNVELLTRLRHSRPDRPYSMTEIMKIRECFFDRIVLVRLAEVEKTVLEYTKPSKRALLSDVAVQALLSHLRNHPNTKLDLLEAICAEDPLPQSSHRYVESYIAVARKAKIDPAPLLASCFSQDSASLSHYYSAHDIFHARYAKLLQEVEGATKQRHLSQSVLLDFRRIIRRSQIAGQTLSHYHLSLLAALNVPAGVKICFSCITRPPIHVLSCSHSLCNTCLATLRRAVEQDVEVDICPFCQKRNTRSFHVPPRQGGRVLVVGGLSVLSGVCFLRDIQSRLFGPIHEYVDMVFGVDEGQRVVSDLFVHSMTPKECLEKHASRLDLKIAIARSDVLSVSPRFPGSLQIATAHRGKIKTSWGKPHKLPKTLSHRETVMEVCRDLWASPIVFGERTESVEIAGQLLAALFYPTIIPVQDGYVLEILCRLPSGNHLLNLVWHLHNAAVQVHCRVNGAWRAKEALCDGATKSRCKSGERFAKRLPLGDFSHESIVRVAMDSMTWPGQTIEITGSPCTANTIMARRCVEEVADAPATPPYSTPSLKSQNTRESAELDEGSGANSDLGSQDGAQGAAHEQECGRVFSEIDKLQELLVAIRSKHVG